MAAVRPRTATVNAVLTPNDENAAPTITYLQRKASAAKTFPVTGQDATSIGLQNIPAWRSSQCGTRVQADLHRGPGGGCVAAHVHAWAAEDAPFGRARQRDGRWITTAGVGACWRRKLLTPIVGHADEHEPTVIAVFRVVSHLRGRSPWTAPPPDRHWAPQAWISRCGNTQPVTEAAPAGLLACNGRRRRPRPPARTTDPARSHKAAGIGSAGLSQEPYRLDVPAGWVTRLSATMGPHGVLDG